MSQTSVIYRIKCKNENIKDTYIGSTFNLNRRIMRHRTACNIALNNAHNYPVYKKIRECGGIDNWFFETMLAYPCETRKELILKEREFILAYKPTLNVCVPLRTKQEYYRDNYDTIKQLRSRVGKCECGSFYTHNHKARHEKTKKHQTYMKFKNELELLKSHLYNVCDY